MRRGAVIAAFVALTAVAVAQDDPPKPMPKPTPRPEKTARPHDANPKPKDATLAKIRELLDQGKTRDALAAIEKAIGASEPTAALLALRGEAKLELGRVAEARVDLERAAKDSTRARALLAKIEFLYARDDKARALLEGAGDDELAHDLPILIDGPFRRAWGDGARICRGRSKDGGYLIYTDLGLDDDTLTKATKRAQEIRDKGGDGVDARLDHALPPTEGVKTCGRIMDTIARAYAAVFPLPKDEQLVHRVYLFSSRDDFLAFSKSIGEDMSDADGFYAPDTRILAIDATPEAGQKELLSENARDTMFHEGFHQYVRFYVPDIPPWFDEGLAEYFGPSKLVGKGELEIGVVRKADPPRTTRYEVISRALKTAKPLAPLSLKDLMTKTDDTFADGDRGEMNYAQAWSFIHFLLASSNEHGKSLVVAFWKALRTGKDARAAYDETFGKEDLSVLEREWKKHVGSM